MSRSNFDHFNTIKEFQDIVSRMKRAEIYRHEDIESSVINCRKSLEILVQWIFDNDTKLEAPLENTLFGMLEDSEFRSIFRKDILQRMDSVRKLGNKANHETDTITIFQAEYCIESMFIILDCVGYLYFDHYEQAKFDRQLFQNPEYSAPIVVTQQQAEALQSVAFSSERKDIDDSNYQSNTSELTADIVNELLGEKTCVNQMTKSELEELLSYMDEGDITLTSEQKECVNFTPKSDLLIKGTAGSGKSIILMQRAIRLRKQSLKDRTPKNILILTYTNALVSSLSQTIGSAIKDNKYISIRTLDSAAAKAFVGAYGLYDGTIDHDNDDNRLAYIEKAKHAVQQLYPNNRILQLPLSTLDEELQWIKGSMIRSLEEYKESGRAGRGGSLRMSDTDYTVTFDLYTEYNRLLKEAGALERLDLFDSLIKNPDLIHDRFKADYVLIDEAQDLQPIIIKFAKLISKESVTIACDSAQKIYSGYFTLRNLGLDIRGRASKSLSSTFRNTREISMLSSDLYRIIKEKESNDPNVEFTDPTSTSKHGDKPAFCQCNAIEQEQELFIQIIKKYLNEKGITIGILYRSKAERSLIEKWLEEANLKDNYQLISGKYSRKGFYRPIRLCSMHSAKGLEFDIVITPLFQKSTIPAEDTIKDLDPSDKEEIINKERKLIYVCFTRPKEKLFVTFTGEPSMFFGELEKNNYDLWKYSDHHFTKTDSISTVNETDIKTNINPTTSIRSITSTTEKADIAKAPNVNNSIYSYKNFPELLVGQYIKNTNNGIIGFVEKIDEIKCYLLVENGPNKGKRKKIPLGNVIKEDSKYTIWKKE